MSLYDYEKSRELTRQDVPFASLIMAAYRKGDTANVAALTACWPEIVAEVQARYVAPGGVLPDEEWAS